jgi:hypothetical protein
VVTLYEHLMECLKWFKYSDFLAHLPVIVNDYPLLLQLSSILRHNLLIETLNLSASISTVSSSAVSNKSYGK